VTKTTDDNKDKYPYYKHRLQEWIHQDNQKFPVYHSKLKGGLRQPKFRSTVEVCGEQFPLDHSQSHLKDAKLDVAGI
jgi:dsRNA-specific ribonuclease